MPANPTNADLQRQLYSVQTDIREINCKLDKALEHSSAHKARLDAHDTAIGEVKDGLIDEAKAREGMGMWVIGIFITALLGLGTAAIGLLTGHKGV